MSNSSMSGMDGMSSGSMSGMSGMSMSSSGQMSAVLMGLMCGLLHAVGPDHLATLVTFSTLMEPMQAARVGAAWGLGHSIGIISIAFLILCIGRLPFVHIESWEYYGDYVIGASLIVVATYFIVKEDEYLEMQDDGKIIVRGCACHPQAPDSRLPDKASRRKGKKFCTDFSQSSSSNDEEEALETTPLVGSGDQMTSDRDVQSGLVGMLQGFCCPMGLIGMGYMAGRTPVEIFVFISVSVVVSILGTAAIAATWAYLTTSNIASDVNPRFIYRCSCALALILGVTWVVLNYMDILDQVNYAH